MLQICKFVLGPHQNARNPGKKDLASLRLVCKDSAESATLLLFSTLYIRCPRRLFTTVSQGLVTLSQDKLARLVKSLCISMMREKSMRGVHVSQTQSPSTGALAQWRGGCLDVIHDFSSLETLELDIGTRDVRQSKPAIHFIEGIMTRLVRLTRLRKLRLRIGPSTELPSLEPLKSLQDLHLNLAYNSTANPGSLPIATGFHRGRLLFPDSNSTSEQFAILYRESSILAVHHVNQRLPSTYRRLLGSLAYLTTLELVMPEDWIHLSDWLLPGDIASTKLKRLGISDGSFDANVLECLIRSNPELEEVCLEGIKLTSGTWQQVINALSDCPVLMFVYLGGFPSLGGPRILGYRSLDQQQSQNLYDNRGYLKLGGVSGLETYRWEDVHAYADLIRQVRSRIGKKWWPQAHWVFERYLNLRPLWQVMAGLASLGDTYETQSWVTEPFPAVTIRYDGVIKLCVEHDWVRRGGRGRSRSVDNPGAHKCWQGPHGNCHGETLGFLHIDQLDQTGPFGRSSWNNYGWWR